MLNAYINAVQNCESYDGGNKLSELLPFIDRLSDNQIEELVKAFNENSQVYDSHGFNGNKSRYYGKGLLHHLRRITNIDYKLSSLGKITKE